MNKEMARMDAEDAERRARLLRPEALLKAALWYAARGVRVFPCHPGTKLPMTRHGFKDAGTDPEEIRAWWAVEPQANVGLPTGHQFDAIDVDPPDGYLSLGEMRDAGLIPPTLGRVSTPRGAHLYIPATGRGNAAGMLPGIDYRGDGGYVIAPPSRTEAGMWIWSEPLDLSS